MKHIVSLTAVLALALMVLASHVRAEVPQLMNYQGLVTDNLGNPLNGTYSFTFRIYDVATGGTALWTETHPSVTVTEGRFSVILGQGTPPVPVTAAVFDGPDRWLGIRVGSDPELTPRTRFTSFPYSFWGAKGNCWDCNGSAVWLTTLTNNVGIGTENPQAILDVAGNDPESYMRFSTGISSHSVYLALNEHRDHNRLILSAYDDSWGSYLWTVDPLAGGGQGFFICGGPSVESFPILSANADRTYFGYNIDGKGNIRGTDPGDPGDVYVRGNVGIGTAEPEARLHVKGSNVIVEGSSDPKILLENTGSEPIGGPCTDWEIIAGGGPATGDDYDHCLVFKTRGDAGDYHQGLSDILFLGQSLPGGPIYNPIEVGINNAYPDYPIHVGYDATNGNGAHLTTGGVWTSTGPKSRGDIRKLDGGEVLGLINQLPIESWEYKGSDERHIWPCAEDFHEAFDVGVLKEDGTRDTQYLAAADMAGVALIGVQELYRMVQDLRTKTQEIEELRAEMAQLQALVETILAQQRSSKGGSDELAITK